MKRVLMVAFHFPPAAMGSGHLRTLGFARYLPSLGWEPIVLSANPAAYPRTDVANESLIPEDCRVRRALALDAGRHLAIRGKYPGFLAKPDRWNSWRFAGVLQGLRLIRRHKVSAIWSTYPIMTAHSIAHTLARITGLPWVADFRDPVSSSVSKTNAFALASQKRHERRVVERAARIVFTTAGAMCSYADHYPAAFRDGRMSVIVNGYDEAAFSDVPIMPPAHTTRPLRLVHSGILYPDGRNPLPFLTALANLRAKGALAGGVEIVLRASGSEAAYAHELQRLDLKDVVTLAPPIPNREALLEQAAADALLLFQGRQFDRQIPAKVYEYLRIGRPIFALVGEDGDTAALLRATGGAEIVPLDDSAAIETELRKFIKAVREGSASIANAAVAQTYSRHQGAVSLATLLDEITTQR